MRRLLVTGRIARGRFWWRCRNCGDESAYDCPVPLSWALAGTCPGCLPGLPAPRAEEIDKGRN